MNDTIIISDFDGTITKKDTLVLFLEKYAPVEWVDIENDWKNKKIGSQECLKKQFGLIPSLTEHLIDDFLKDIEIDEDMKQKSLKTIKRQAERLSRMIEDLLVIPDIEGSRLNFNLVPISISSIIENSITLVKNDANKEIINNVEQCETHILADNDRIEQVFVNLIENAIKYSKENSPITINYEIENDKLIIAVQNEYDVIPREKLKTLFEKFTRIDDSTTRTTRGTGLGLYIVKGLVEGMGGEIRLYSNEECGFCVKVYMNIIKD